MADLLRIAGLSAGYNETTVLEAIDLSLPQAGALAILGRNGVGKTTLLATIMGHTTFRSGSIQFDGVAIETEPTFRRCRRGIGYVPQAREIFPSLTVAENLLVAERRGPAAARGTAPRWTIDRVYDLFPRLAERRSNGGNQLSGGEQQMLAIGRALMGNPRLLLLDEPMEGLAPVIVDMLVAAIGRLKREDGLALILVEQHARLALGITDTAIVMSRGRVVHTGASAALAADPERLVGLVVAH